MNDISSLIKAEQSVLVNVGDSGNLAKDVGAIIERAKETAYRSVDVMLVYRNWFIGKRIAEEELRGDSRAKYGQAQLAKFAETLTQKYGKGFDASNLYKFLAFFKRFPILDTLCPKSGNLLGWSHYRDTDSDIARYSMLKGNEQLFASKYKLCLPSEKELRDEIEAQKQRFIEQHS